MLCHEIFHAKNNAVDSVVLADALVETSLRSYEDMRKSGREKGLAANEEPLYEDDTDAELGYLWEKLVFGGHIHRDLDFDTCVWFSKWPSYWASTDYLRRGGYVLFGITFSYFVANFGHPPSFYALMRDSPLWFTPTLGRKTNHSSKHLLIPSLFHQSTFRPLVEQC